MKRLNYFLSTVMVILSGMIGSSMLITHSNTWKVILPIFVLIVAFKNYINEER